MNRNRLNLNGLELEVYQEGKGKTTLLFIHGNSLSAKTFQKQIESPLSEDYRLITFDLPGHGQSDKAQNPEETYNLPSYCSIVKELIAKLNLEQVVLVGHSLGGHIAVEASEEIPEVIGMMVFGTPPFNMPPDLASMYLPNPAAAYAFQGPLSNDEIPILATSYSKCENDFSKLIEQTDPEARAYMGASVGQGKFKDEIAICQQLKYPMAILHGEEDALVNREYLFNLDLNMWKGEPQLIKNCGHSPQWEQADEVNKMIEEYCQKIIG